jgi:hypothetical protein
MHGDADRDTDDFPQLGLSFGLHAWKSILPAAGMLARKGNTAVYNFTSSEGAHGVGGTAHAKLFEDVLDTYIEWIDGAYPPHSQDLRTNEGRSRSISPVMRNLEFSLAPLRTRSRERSSMTETSYSPKNTSIVPIGNR